MRLSKRLLMVSSLTGHCDTAADIGSDHCYLPVYLIRTGASSRCIATDIRSGPLDRARATVAAEGLSDLVELRLSNGLRSCCPNEAQVIIIAGMGGNTIIDILSETPWAKDGNHRIVLQAMTGSDKLRLFLWNAGYVILQEALCEDRGKFYNAFACVGGLPRTAPPPLLTPYFSPLLLKLRSRYVCKIIGKLEKERAGILSGVSPNPLRISELNRIIDVLEKRFI